MRRHATRLALAAGLAYCLVCAAAWALQERLIFAPSSGRGDDPASRGMAFETVRIEAADGVVLNAWYLAPPRPDGRHVLFLHGNAGHLSHRLPTLATLQSLGHGVLIIDYRGYGLSEGEPSVAGTLLDAAAAWRWLTRERGVPAADIVLYGRSLGGGVAAALAAQTAPRGLILESTFTRLADAGAARYPWLPVDLLLRADYDTIARLPELDCPVLVAHSPADRVVPYAMGAALAAAAPTLVEFVELGGSHNRAFRAGGTAYHQRLDRFIRTAR
ncbi:MAG: alpha/beta hydrolase [Gammaproteobacteria bacterium]